MYKLDCLAILIGRFAGLVLAIPVMLHPALSLSAAEPASTDVSRWKVFIAHDNCPDYTWGFTEEQTRQAYADIVKAHLDEMKRTDDQPSPNQDRY